MRRPPALLVLSPSTGGYFFGELLSGIARVVADHGGRLLVVQTLELGMRSDELGEPPDFLLPIGWTHVDGAIAITSAVPDKYLRALQVAGVPVVTASSRRGAVPLTRAVPDSRGGTAAAVSHLIAHGHRRIGFVGNLSQTDIRDRFHAYRETLTRHGMTAEACDVFRVPDNGEAGGAAGARQLLAAGDRPTAVMIGTDRNAIGFMDGLGQGGLTVPDDVAVVSFDDIEGAAFCVPALTTVSQSFSDVGALAARIVLDQINGGPTSPTEHRAPARLVRRASCGCTPATPTGAAGAPADGEDRPDRLAALLNHHVVRSRGAATWAAGALAAHLVDAVDVVAGSAPGRAHAAIGTIGVALGTSGLPPQALRRVCRHLRDRALAAGDGPAVSSLVRELADLEARAFVIETTAFDREFDEQFGVDTGLLGAAAQDPRSLSWLERTHARSGVLALWQHEREGESLTVVGVHDPDGRLDVPVGSTFAVDEFPPPTLIDDAQPAEAQICVVVPVRTRTREWGLLAITGEIDTTSARETYHHWATLLGACLDQVALQAAIVTSERRYAAAARATNEGLWEWQLGADHLYLSDRGRSLLGVGPATEAVGDVLATLLPADVELVREALAGAMSTPDRAAEVEFRITRDGAERWLLLRGLGLADAGGTVRSLVGSLRDIDTRKQLEEQLRQAALFDAITGLPNRRLFLDRLDVAVRQRQRQPDRTFAVIFLDLDGFKLVNDSLGHLRGDELLRVIGDRLRHELRGTDTAARFGGDEFAVLLVDPDPHELLVIAQRLQQRICEPVLLGGEEVSVTASVGITTSSACDTDAEAVLRDADVAMYHAKEAERGSAALFDPTMHGRADDRLRLSTELRAALVGGQFAVHYQPIVSLDGTGLTQFEALVRWDHPDRGRLLPGAFLPALADGPGIVLLGTWIVDSVCAQIARWRDVHGVTATVAVNLSHREFWSAALPSMIESALSRHRVPASSLVLEITETVVMTDARTARDRMGQLRALGVRLHIDDFGTGTSSLHALRTLPVDALKIDGSFVRDLAHDPQTASLVAVIVEMGRALGVGVVAECVETTDQADQLRAMGCADAQGWLYATALPGDEAGRLLGQPLGACPPQTPGIAPGIASEAVRIGR